MCFLAGLSSFSQKIVGHVIDAKTKIPIEGVSIKSKATSAQTDEKGNFSLSISGSSIDVNVTHIGYDDQKMTLKAGAEVTIELKQNAEGLQEVVVIGYGTTRKKDLTGSVAVVGQKDFVKGNFATPEQLIQGKVAGVSVSTNGGAPGAGSTIRIRGGASLNASNDPLIVIDGILISNDRISGQANPLALINPSDIESFSILKDASATAIFGSRASNGVILITTKKGKSGKIKFNVNNQLALQTVYQQNDILSPDQVRTIVNNNGEARFINLLGSANTYWQNEIFKNATSNQLNFSASGNIVKNLPFRVSVSNLYQDGILKTGNLNRNSLNFNLSPSLLDNHLKIDFNVLATLSNTRFANEGAISAASSFNPTVPVLSGNSRYNGYWEWLDPLAASGLRSLAPRNPVGLLESRDDRSTVQRLISNLKIDYSIHGLPDLKVVLNVGIDRSLGKGNILINDSAASNYQGFQNPGDPNFYRGYKANYTQERNNLYINGYLNYTKNFKDILYLDALAGFETQKYYTKNYNYPTYSYNGVLNLQSEPRFPFDEPQYAINSVLGRLNLDFLSKYVFTFTLREDASSKFSASNRALLTPAAAFAWNIHNENIFKNGNFLLSNFKFRASWGVTGQQDGIGYYDYISFYNLSTPTATYQLGNSFYDLYRPGGYYPNRTWEKTTTGNLGIEVGLDNNRYQLIVDLYNRNTTDLLNSITQPALTNFTNQIVANVGSMQVKGIEVSLIINPIKTKNVDWDFALNVAYNKNEITNLLIAPDPNFPGVSYGGISGGTGNNILINSVGYRRGSFYVYKQVYDLNNKPIDNLFEDLNRDGVINEKDLYRYQGVDPYYVIGFTNNIRLWRFTIGLNFRANLGNYVYNNVASSTGTLRNILNPLGYVNNGSANYLKSNFTGSGDKYILSDYYVENASFLRLDNCNISYNIGKVFKNTGDLTINANIQNAFILTNYSGVDPEINGGIDNNFYPRPRTFVIGFNWNF